jgi:hypothetical protein
VFVVERTIKTQNSANAALRSRLVPGMLSLAVFR